MTRLVYSIVETQCTVALSGDLHMGVAA